MAGDPICPYCGTSYPDPGEDVPVLRESASFPDGGVPAYSVVTDADLNVLHRCENGVPS